MMLARRTVFVSVALAAVLAGTGQVRADWLVTSEGARVETRGPWEVRGKLVVFTAPDGTLASVRLSTVDLEASRRVTAEALRPKPAQAAAPARRKSVTSITDKDFPKVPRAAAPAEGGAAAPAAASSAAAPAPTRAVVVENWQQQERAEGDGIEILGVLRNQSPDIATELGLTVSTLDETGATTATAEASLTSTTLEPRGTINFQAFLPGVFTFASANFDVRSKGLRLQTAEPKKPEE
ncbi:MAG TPA: hypothetical protein VEG34_08405 [Thermoanaerobaculia bacterium]|nr:hypothetical protein [Thermoanaerobaculia bacterium]